MGWWYQSLDYWDFRVEAKDLKYLEWYLYSQGFGDYLAKKGCEEKGG